MLVICKFFFLFLFWSNEGRVTRSSCCLCLDVSPHQIVELDEASIAKQRLGEHAPAATNEELATVSLIISQYVDACEKQKLGGRFAVFHRRIDLRISSWPIQLF
jgi:hypothetical protein